MRYIFPALDNSLLPMCKVKNNHNLQITLTRRLAFYSQQITSLSDGYHAREYVPLSVRFEPVPR